MPNYFLQAKIQPQSNVLMLDTNFQELGLNVGRFLVDLKVAQ